MKEKTLSLEKAAKCIASASLFRKISPEMLHTSLRSYYADTTICAAVFSPGEAIPVIHEGNRSLILVLSGTATVYSLDEEHPVILRTIGPSDIFGISILFSDEAPVSLVRAKEKLTALFLPASLIDCMLRASPEFSMNYISFLSSKICFLNRKIASYTAGSTERKLALHLSTLQERNDGTLDVGCSMTALAESLDVSRASLYRALDRLSAAGLILYSGREIRILDRGALLCDKNT